MVSLGQTALTVTPHARAGLDRVRPVPGVIALAWLLTKYVEEPAYRALAALRVRGLGARAFVWLTT